MDIIDAVAIARLFVKTYIPRYPLDLNEFAETLGLEKPVRFRKTLGLPDEVSAIVYGRESFDNTYILTNANHPLTRQRFGGCHELAHLYLGHEGHLNFYSWDNWCLEDPRERAEADAFATESLMPALHSFTMASKVKSPMSLLRSLQIAFNASLEAVARRIIELEIYKEAACVFLYKGRVAFKYATKGFEVSQELVLDLLFESLGSLKPGQANVLSFYGLTTYVRRNRDGLLAFFVERQTDLYKRLAEVL